MESKFTQLTTDVKVIFPRGRKTKGANFRALIDTGSSGTCVSPRLVKQLHLFASGKGPLSTPNENKQDADQYFIKLQLECNKRQGRTITFEFHAPRFKADQPNFDVILGMDVLGTADLEVRSNKFRTFYSLVIPGDLYNVDQYPNQLRGYADLD